MNDTGWEPTSRGGVRRTRVAQTYDEAGETTKQARGAAAPDVEGVGNPVEARPERLPNTKEVGGSNPSSRAKKFIFKWREQLGLPSCPYLIRWRLETPWGSIRLHHWLGPDDDRAPHDHPWWFATFVLKGGYVDRSGYSRLDGGTGFRSEELKAPAFRYRPAHHIHTVFPLEGGCWTIIITGPKSRKWGFWVKGKFVKMNKYFLTYGHHPCN
jgi:hypothetical protein